jgi:hypothetical protein
VDDDGGDVGDEAAPAESSRKHAAPGRPAGEEEYLSRRGGKRQRSIY